MFIYCLGRYVFALPRFQDGVWGCNVLSAGGGESDDDGDENGYDDDVIDFYPFIYPPNPPTPPLIWDPIFGYTPLAINPYTYDPNNPFDNITIGVDVPDDPLIDDGVGVEDFYEDFFANNATYVIPQYRKIGVTTDRGHTEDLTSGTDGNTSGILSYYSNRTDQELFNQMNELITACTILSPNTLLNTGIKMIDKFKNGPQNPPFRDKDLDDEVANSSAMKNFVKKFRDRLSDKLKLK